ncbi:MAG TPA: PQQ-binding-like beta-propeller repeat protein, partial [Puia sp.]|nr:PQQ-binding-like beta-propeller repeat protein [Puia sp.]
MLLPLAFVACHSAKDGNVSWAVYGGSRDAIHYSSLSQIDTGNVGQLQKVWEYHTGDGDSLSQIQVNSLIIDGVLYGVSPKLKLFALEAATGKMRWVFDPAAPVNGDTPKIAINACRGVAYYAGDGGGARAGAGGAGDRKDARLFYGAGSWLYCVDAGTGRPAAGFGDSGRIDLHHDLGRDVHDLYVTATTPGVVYRDMIIIGDRVAEEAAAAPGHIRAYDVHTGKLRWIFHTIPYPGEPGYESWEDTAAYKHIGGANAWSGFSLDEERGMLFAPVGSASFDFYGGRRAGNDLYANCVLALDANTGKRLWHFQTVHHDIWDRDPPTPPVLVTVLRDGKPVPAVAQVTKSGFVFLLDRLTGAPLSPVEERPVPPDSALPGEKLSPTQPMPTGMPVFSRQSLTEAELNSLVPDSSLAELKKRLAGYKSGRLFIPPSRQGTVIFPGFDGGAEWGGPAYDPGTGLLYVNANEMPWVLTMVDAKKANAGSVTVGQAAKALYATNCMVCHGASRQGGGNFPTLIGMNKKYTTEQFVSLIADGRRMMPAFKQLSDDEKKALAVFVLDQGAELGKKFVNKSAGRAIDPYFTLPYAATGYNKFLTKEGYPAVAPPWGTLTAMDLSKGVIVWRDTLGDYPEFKARGIHTGTENYGGAVVTAGGVLFIAAASDAKLRAYNKRTGQLLWEGDLPAAGFATPSVYAADGREFVVIACGGGKLHK